MRTITARRSGFCPMCGQHTSPGDTIAPMPRGAGQWAHAECVAQYRRDLAADDLDALTYGA